MSTAGELRETKEVLSGHPVLPVLLYLTHHTRAQALGTRGV